MQENTVVILHTECPLADTEYSALRSAINPLEEHDDYGISLYLPARACVCFIVYLHNYVYALLLIFF